MTIERIMADMQRAARGFAAGQPCAEQAIEALRAFGEAAAKASAPPVADIAKLRMDMLATEHGWYRFVMPEYWRWWRLSRGDLEAAE